MEYFEPQTSREAVEILTQYDGKARVIAGGTDVLVDMKYKATPPCLVNIKRIRGLSFIAVDGNSLRLGPLTTIRELETNSLIRERFPVIWSSAHQFASVQIRNTATVGGNICRASPSGETLAPLLILGAKAKAMFPDGEREVSFEEFFLGPGMTVLGSTGLLTEIQVPYPPEGSQGLYLKHAVRGAMDIAMVGVSVMLTADLNAQSVTDVRAGLTAVAPTPLRASKAESVVIGKAMTPELVSDAARVAAMESMPITDHRASAEYRRWIVEALMRRGLESAWSATLSKE